MQLVGNDEEEDKPTLQYKVNAADTQECGPNQQRLVREGKIRTPDAHLVRMLPAPLAAT